SAPTRSPPDDCVLPVTSPASRLWNSVRRRGKEFLPFAPLRRSRVPRCTLSRLRAGRETGALAPEDIENKTFPAVVRGYERSAVDAFLREVAEEVRRLQALAARATAQPAARPAPDAAPAPPAQPEHADALADPYD